MPFMAESTLEWPCFAFVAIALSISWNKTNLEQNFAHTYKNQEGNAGLSEQGAIIG